MNTMLEDAVDRWREASLIDDATATAIHDFEARRGPPPPAGADRRGDGRVGVVDVPRTEEDHGALPSVTGGLVAEVLAYVGATLVIGAALPLLGGVWDDLSGPARILVLAAITLALGGTAASLPTGDDRIARLRSLLGALAAVGVAATVGVGLVESTSAGDDVVAVLSGLAGLAAAAFAHGRRPSWPTTLALGAATMSVLLGGANLLDLTDSELVTGAVVAGAGLAWAALGWSGTARPQNAFEVTGLLVGGTAIQLLAFDDTAVLASLLVGLAVSTGALLVGLLEDRNGPAVMGGLGLTVFAPQAVAELFGDAASAQLMVLVGGLVLVTTAVVVLRRKALT